MDLRPLTFSTALLLIVATTLSPQPTARAATGSIDLGGMLAAAAKPSTASSVVDGQVRFQVLAPSVVRMEFSRAAHFCDAPSVSVLKRDWPSVELKTRREAGWLEIDTGRMILRYRLGS